MYRPLGIMALACFATMVAGSASAADPVRLTFDGRLKQDPVFTKNGEQLYYVEQASAVQLRIVRRNMADGQTVAVHENETKSEYEPSMSPDGRWLAFIQS